MIFSALFIFCFFFILTAPARAYLDPGSGSFIFQIIVAAILGSLFSIKQYYSKIKSFIFKSSSKNKDCEKQDGKNDS